MQKKYPYIVVGAGAAGLTVSVGLARSGKKVLLVEDQTYGGDCTNFGCIPSKTLIAQSKRIRFLQNKKEEGKKALQTVRETVARVRGHEEPNALHELGIETATAKASFLSTHRLALNFGDFEAHVEGRTIVLAVGSRPKIPKIPGLEKVPYLTNETLFDLKEVPSSLIVLGAGPIGCELAQAFNRLGSQVMIVQRSSQLLKKEEPAAAAVIEDVFRKEGIQVYLDQQVTHINYKQGHVYLSLKEKELKATHILVASGRQPRIENLKLENAGIRFSEKGIPVDAYGRTNQKHIWAVGDITGEQLYTHFAENRARSVFLSLILPISLKQDAKQPVPRVTFTDPEIASFGFSENRAIEQFSSKKIKTFFVPFSTNDRAITAGREEGFVQIVTLKNSSKILGATIVGPRAGEMLMELSLAAYFKIPLRKLGGLIHPYPIYNLAIRKAADQWMKEVFVPKIKQPLRWHFWSRFLPIMTLLVFMVGAYMSPLRATLTFENLADNREHLLLLVRTYPLISPFCFIGAYAIATALSLPGGALLSLIGGFLFPVPWSTFYVVLGATLGACLLFLAARSAFGNILKKRLHGRLDSMREGLEKNAASYLLFLRLVPLFPFWLVNLAPAFFGVSFWTYVWTTFLGIIPGAFVFTQAGTGLSQIFETGGALSLGAIFNTQVKIALVALGLFSLLPIFIKKLFKKED